MNTIIQNYTFDVTAKTITFTDYSTIKLENIIRIVNLTRGIILYDPQVQEPRHFNPFTQNTGRVGNDNVFTFNDLPKGEMVDSDKLLIEYYDIDNTGSVDIGDVDITSIAAGETHIGEVSGKSVVVNSSFTRPSDTTTYAAGEVVGPTAGAAVMTFTNCARVNGGSGVITHATLVDGANVSTKGSFELWLYDTTFTADADNAVFTPTDAEALTVVGVIPFTLSYVGDATSGINGNAVYMGTIDRPIPFVAGASSRNLFGAIVVRNAYVPVSAETFDVRLFINQN